MGGRIGRRTDGWIYKFLADRFGFSGGRHDMVFIVLFYFAQ